MESFGGTLSYAERREREREREQEQETCTKLKGPPPGGA